jgi:hypothetical protein
MEQSTCLSAQWLPGGKESKWIKTMPARAWFACFRRYGPRQRYCDKSWRLPDIEANPAVGLAGEPASDGQRRRARANFRKVMRLIGEESKRNRTNTPTARQINQISKSSRIQQSKQSARIDV